MPSLKFSYTGVNFLANKTTLPSHNSNAKDFWGYYNGKSNNGSLFPKLYVYPALDYPDKVRITPLPSYSGETITLPGADRNADPVLMEIGALNKIQYPLGGSLYIDYEPHTYYDATADLTIMGGGLRVRSLTFFDGINPSNAISKDFIYEEQPSKSSGRLLAFPVFHIPTSKYVFEPESGSAITKSYNDLLSGSSNDLWDRLLVRTEVNLAYESFIRYKKVTVKKPGSGWTTVEYELPAIAGDLAVGDWTATINKFARYSSCEPMGIIAGGAWRYPNAYNPNYQYEREMPIKTSYFNEAGVRVKETTHTYQYLYKDGAGPFKVWGLNFEKMPNQDAFAFGKYFLLTDVARVPLTITNTTYDAQNTTKSTTQTMDFLYESSAHKLLTATKTTNSDGSVYTSRIRYPLDFGIIPSTTDEAADMIRQLQADNRVGLPIETYQTIQKPGETEKVVSASLIKFSDFGGSTPRLESTYSLSSSEPLTYSLSTSGPTDFAPAAIELTQGEYRLEPHVAYEQISQITGYASENGVPITFNDPVKKVIGGIILGYHGTVAIAEVRHATPDQMAFSDFETESARSFEATELIYGAGRTGVNAIHASVSLSKTVTKGSSNSYVLTFWIKTDGTPVNFDITVKDATQVNTLAILPTFIANSSAASVYTRVHRLIDVSSFPGTFSIEIKGQAGVGPFVSSPSLLPVLDDVAFYPEDAELTTRTFDIPWGETSVTDYTGLTSYQEYDGAGRNSISRDKNSNIKIKNTYQFASLPDVLANTYDIEFSRTNHSSENLQPAIIYVEQNIPISFIADEQSHEGVTYEWDFGSGFVAGTRELTQTFSPGTYDVTLRVSKAGYATVTSHTISVIVIGTFTICAEGVKNYNPITNSVNAFFEECYLVSGTIASMATGFGAGNEYTGTHKWKIRDIGSSYWTPLGSGVQQVHINDLHLRHVSFEVICEIWNGPDLTARSNIIQIIFSL